jgi:tRNA threonylcarbamoyladenosine biosynthesis protein TsaB
MILSIETATDVCSVALHNKSKLLAYSELFTEKSHSSALTLLIESMVAHTQISMADLEGIALSQGPGSYTGLRVGASVAKGLCYALEIPLYAIDTLLAMAHTAQHIWAGESFLLCPMIDARRMEVYTSVYDKQLQTLLPTQPVVFDKGGEELLLSKLVNPETKIVLFGNGAKKCKQASKSNHFILLELIYPMAKAVWDLFYLLQPPPVDIAYFEPFYLKPFQTQASLKSKQI